MAGLKRRSSERRDRSNAQVRRELLYLQQRDLETRQRLLDSGALFEDYHPQMEQIHLENARRLVEILAAGGWPGRSQVGDDGCAAAFLVASHAISRPDLQRHWLTLLEEAAERGEVAKRQAAVLGDRIRFHEGRPQRFGAILDWDRQGELTAGAIEDPESVDARRRAVGLEPLARILARAKRAAAAGEAPSGDFESRQRRQQEWAEKVGWR